MERCYSKQSSHAMAPLASFPAGSALTAGHSAVQSSIKRHAVKRHHHKHNIKHRYEFLETLGKGTYGKVKKAVERSGRVVAIKSIRKEKIKDEQDLIHIRREIEIMSSLSHPHIITINEVFENKHKIVIVMEYASKGDLYDYICEKQRLSEQEARHFFRQIVSAVHYCHRNGIVHRDLKLENILLDGNGNIKTSVGQVNCFGLSNLYHRDEYLQTFCGSPLYASPEIVTGQPYRGPEVDSWSLGVLLYTLVHGAMPFDGHDYKNLVKQITSGQYREPAKHSDASGLIRWMLMVNPERRATVEDVAGHWWLNWGYLCPLLGAGETLASAKHASVEAADISDSAGGLAGIADWLRRTSRPLFENGSKVRCLLRPQGGVVVRQRSVRKSRKANDVSQTLQDKSSCTDKQPKGILKKRGSFRQKMQAAPAVDPVKTEDAKMEDPFSNSEMSPPTPPASPVNPAAPRKGILKKPVKRESGYYSSPERSDSSRNLASLITPPPEASSHLRKGILKKNGKFSSGSPSRFGSLDELAVLECGSSIRSHPSGAIGEDRILDRLELPEEEAGPGSVCRVPAMRGCVSADNLLGLDESERGRPHLWNMRCYEERVGDSAFSLTDCENVTEVYKRAVEIRGKIS
ncbi:NUAK family SNF1-like kinase 2 [Polyodon spathula]|uniref:NUAK family SNF1-like kinase 2 n=1 Tax=Polyodon spathula TaxID=7913 RepID=UPI001B7F2BDF|nr:NUAK family SNF1-like kinase 2 [Polyodon spathula]